MIEIVIGAALLGGLSVGVMHLSQNQAVIQKQSESDLEINALSNLVVHVLLSEKACLNTLGGKDAPISEGPVSDVKSRSGKVLLSANSSYGANNIIKIKSMELKDLTTLSAKGITVGDARFEIGFEKTSNMLKAQNQTKTITKSFPLQVELKGGKLVKCYSSVENSIETIRHQACQSIGGQFEATSDSCKLLDFDKTRPVASFQAVSNKYLGDFTGDWDANTLKFRYVDVKGDTMKGPLTVEGAVKIKTDGKKFCVGDRCREFKESSCSDDSVLTGIKKDGTKICSKAACPEGQYFVGVDNTSIPGKAVCESFPPKKCNKDQYVYKVNADKSVVCKPLPKKNDKRCPNGSIRRIDPDDNLTCAPIVYGQICNSGFFLRGYDSQGKIICNRDKTAIGKGGCSSGQVLTGYTSSGLPRCRAIPSKSCPDGEMLKSYSLTGGGTCGSIKYSHSDSHSNSDHGWASSGHSH